MLEQKLKQNLMNDKECYVQFCQKEENIPLFLQPWWLDAVTQPDGKRWDVLLAKNKNDEIEAVLPFITGKKFGLKYVIMPQLTQYTGVWIKDKINENNVKRISREKHLQNSLIQQLNKLNVSYFELNFSLTYKNWLPFYWAGYNQKTCYTYRLEDISDTDKVFKSFFPCKQRQIRKAQKILHIEYSMSADEFYELRCKHLYAQGKKNILSKQFVCNIINTSLKRKQGIIVSTVDNNGDTHAAIFVVWDKICAYQLITAINPKYKYTGASTFVVLEAIKKLSKETKSYDFCGSMIEEVEYSNRQFGTVQTPYFKISKYIKLISILKEILHV